jgi:hypothetical protein
MGSTYQYLYDVLKPCSVICYQPFRVVEYGYDGILAWQCNVNTKEEE